MTRSALTRTSCALWAAFLAVSGQGNSTAAELEALPFGADESLQRLASEAFSDHLHPASAQVKCKIGRVIVKQKLRLVTAITTLGPLFCHVMTIVMIACLPWTTDAADSWVATVASIAASVAGLSFLVYCGGES